MDSELTENSNCNASHLRLPSICAGPRTSRAWNLFAPTWPRAMLYQQPERTKASAAPNGGLCVFGRWASSFARQRLRANQFSATLFVLRRRTTAHAGGGGSVFRAPIWLRDRRQKGRPQAVSEVASNSAISALRCMSPYVASVGRARGLAERWSNRLQLYHLRAM